jgi:hydroxyacylglutathione hydrolase
MRELADDVWHIRCLPGLPWAVNAYLAGDVLIDAGCRQSAGRILKQLDDHAVTAHGLTHAHPDHQGASREVCDRLDIPFWCPEADIPAAEDPDVMRERQPDKFMARF